MKCFMIFLKPVLVALSAHLVAFELEFNLCRRAYCMGGMTGIADRPPFIVLLQEFAMNTVIIYILNQDVAFAAGFRDELPADFRVRMGMRQYVVYAMAVVACRRHNKAVDQKGAAMYGIDELGNGVLLVYFPRFKDVFFLMAYGACFVEVKAVNHGLPVLCSQDIMLAMAALAGCSHVVAMGCADSVDALFINLCLVGMARFAQNFYGLAVIMRGIFPVPGAAVAVKA